MPAAASPVIPAIISAEKRSLTTAAAESTPPVLFTPPVVAQNGARVVIPPDIRRVLKSEVELTLRVGVDKSGRVTNVVPIGPIGKVEQSLARSYAEALKTWAFLPARQNGTPSAGETILQFRVTPDPR
jgi:outer membrane biosynthesis protein TonB